MLAPIQTALLVEDDPSHAIPVELLLQDLNIATVLTAPDAETEVALSRKHRVDLLLCDLRLPGKDGFSLIEEISRLPYRPRVIILSALEENLLGIVSRMAIDMGVKLLGAVCKPLQPEILQALLTRQLPASNEPQPSTAASAPPMEMSDAVLLRALEQKLFEPFFEARINRDNGQIEGIEVLARMRLLGAGMVLPAQFVGRLEALGKIAEISCQIVGKAFASISRYRGEGLPLRVSINISPLMLGKDSLIDYVIKLADMHGLNYQDITLEITESAAIAMTPEVMERLVRFRLRGFGLSIDDFGTGFASLAQLSKVPFTEMKLDRSFIIGALADQKSRAVLESSIDLARRLGIKVCAEGVENSGLFRLLHDLQVDEMQGRYFHRPMGVHEFFGWAKDWNQRTTIASLYGSKPGTSAG